VGTHRIWRREVTADQVGFAAARQILAIRRIVTPKSATAKASDEVSYGITSLDFFGTWRAKRPRRLNPTSAIRGKKHENLGWMRK